MINIALAIQYMYPEAEPLVDYLVMDNGDAKGQHLAVWNYSQPEPTPEQLDTAWLSYCKQTKLAELSNACQATIYGGFIGTDGHKYQFTDKDQGNLTQQMLFLVHDPTITTVQWKTEDAGVVSMSTSAFLQVCQDANNFKRVNFGKYWKLEANVNAATTEDEINSIVW